MEQQRALQLELKGLWRHRDGVSSTPMNRQTIVDPAQVAAEQVSCVLELTHEHIILRLNQTAFASYAWENARKVG